MRIKTRKIRIIDDDTIELFGDKESQESRKLLGKLGWKFLEDKSSGGDKSGSI